MCGICGYYKKGGKIDKKKFDKMVDIISHRGPDDRGTFYESSLALGHRRLSILDLSEAGHQPYIYQERYVLVYNGEIYNFKELRRQLEEQGYQFHTETDTEVLIACYAAYGQKCVNYFNGMWAFCIFDREKQILFCSRDRYGVKPFYYYYKNGDFLFASEIKQFWEVMEEKPKANKSKLLDFIVWGSQDNDEKTFFKDILKLPAGCNAVFDMKKNRLKLSKYYDLKKVKEKDEGFQKACQNFKEEFEKSVRLRLRADVPVGGCLSGGLDSSAITCVAKSILEEESPKAEYHTVSSCFEDKRYDEQEYIDIVVDRTNVCPHKVFPNEADLFKDLDKIIWHMDEPFASTSIFAQWNVFKEAKRLGLTVMLDGQGADEQLAGYTGFYLVDFIYYLRRFRFKKFRQEFETYTKLRGPSESAYKEKSMFYKRAYLPYWMERMVRYILFIRYMLRNNGPFHWKLIFRDLLRRPNYCVRNPRKYIYKSVLKGMQGLLHYEDRNSMAHSIESRVVFLDVNLVESNFATPFVYKLRNGETKAVLRYGLADYLPPEIKNRYSKLGFVTPEDQWINHNFEKYKEEFDKACDKLAHILDAERLKKWFAVNEGEIARGDFTAWRVICAGHWLDVFGVDLVS